MIIKLVPPAVMAKWLARNRRRTDPRITEEEIRSYAKRVHESVGYDASNIQSRGIFVWRAEKSREMGRRTDDYLLYVFDRTKEFSFDGQYTNDLFAVQRILRDYAEDELEAARRLYHRPSHARKLSASLAASVLDLRELAEGQERPDREARQLLLERVQQIRADDHGLLYCPPAITRQPRETSSGPSILGHTAIAITTTAATPSGVATTAANPSGVETTTTTRTTAIASSSGITSADLTSTTPSLSGLASSRELPTPLVLDYENIRRSNGDSNGATTAQRLAAEVCDTLFQK